MTSEHHPSITASSRAEKGSERRPFLPVGPLFPAMEKTGRGRRSALCQRLWMRWQRRDSDRRHAALVLSPRFRDGTAQAATSRKVDNARWATGRFSSFAWDAIGFAGMSNRWRPAPCPAPTLPPRDGHGRVRPAPQHDAAGALKRSQPAPSCRPPRPPSEGARDETEEAGEFVSSVTQDCNCRRDIAVVPALPYRAGSPQRSISAVSRQSSLPPAAPSLGRRCRTRGRRGRRSIGAPSVG